ncbi:MAG: HU family DNA-binding protein [Planctomycetota bacterium]|nr:HU family DNA-binding protein [Planctomycetota bacterium]
MNKKDLVDYVAERQGLTRSAAEETVDCVFAAIRDGVQGDGEVVVAGFGSWQMRQRQPRTIRNPQTGEPMDVPAGTGIGFRPARAWRDSLTAATQQD